MAWDSRWSCAEPATTIREPLHIELSTRPIGLLLDLAQSTATANFGRFIQQRTPPAEQRRLGAEAVYEQMRDGRRARWTLRVRVRRTLSGNTVAECLHMLPHFPIPVRNLTSLSTVKNQDLTFRDYFSQMTGWVSDADMQRRYGPAPTTWGRSPYS